MSEDVEIEINGPSGGSRLVTIASTLATLIGAVTGIVIAADRLGFLNPKDAVVDPNAPPTELTVASIESAVNPEGFSGKCPATFEFLGRIQTTGPEGTVTYRWVRSDGTEGPEMTLDTLPPDTHEIETMWTIGDDEGDGDYWQQLVILSPKPMRSNRAEFRLRCR